MSYHCNIVLVTGSNPEEADITEYTKAMNNRGIVNISSLPHGTIIYATVRCTNDQDLTKLFRYYNIRILLIL